MVNFDALYTKGAADATKAHADAGQKYGDKCYSVHLQAVENVLRRFGFSDQTLILAAWQHDRIEDTGCTHGYLEREYGKDVADLVYAVTDEPGKNRKERHKATFPKTRAHPRGPTLKLADRIANSEAPEKLAMYKKEFPEFKQALYIEGDGNGTMWEYLESLYQWQLS